MAWYDFIPAFNKYQYHSFSDEGAPERKESIPVSVQKTSAESLFFAFENAGKNFYFEVFFDTENRPQKSVLNVFEGKKQVVSESGDLSDIMSLLFSFCR